MAEPTCAVDDCDTAPWAKGLCGTHYARLRRHGSPYIKSTPPKPKATCSIDDCSLPSVCRGMCDMHYTRLRRHGDPLVTLPRPESRHLRIVLDQLPTTECIPWPGRIADSGYAVTSRGTRAAGMTTAHRRVYEVVVGPVADDLDLDHLCHTNDPDCFAGNACPHRACVNPAHLEPVSVAENIRRSRRWSRNTA